jgi:hypothetical protein
VQGLRSEVERGLTSSSVFHAHVEHGIVQGATHQKLQREIYGALAPHQKDLNCALEHTVDPLLVGKRLALLRLVPFDDQSISEREGRTRVGRAAQREYFDSKQDQENGYSQLIAVVQRSSKCRLDVAHELFLQVLSACTQVLLSCLDELRILPCW